MKSETVLIAIVAISNVTSLEYARFVRYGCASFDGSSSESKGQMTLEGGLSGFMDDPAALYIQFS